MSELLRPPAESKYAEELLYLESVDSAKKPFTWRLSPNMVRIFVGTLVDVGRGRLDPGAMERALASGERRDAGITAPPDGLVLHDAELDDEGREAFPSEAASAGYFAAL